MLQLQLLKPIEHVPCFSSTVCSPLPIGSSNGRNEQAEGEAHAVASLLEPYIGRGSKAAECGVSKGPSFPAKGRPDLPHRIKAGQTLGASCFPRM
jgi:hypothetical protein